MNVLLRVCCSYVSLVLGHQLYSSDMEISLHSNRKSPAHGLQNRYRAAGGAHSYEGSTSTSPQRVTLSTDNAPGDPALAVVNCRRNRCLF